MRKELEFRQFNQATRLMELTDPTSATITTEPDGGGATIEGPINLLDGSHQKETGIYFFTPGEDSGSYSEATWYYAVPDAAMPNGTTVTEPRTFYYQAEGEIPEPPTPPTGATYRVTGIQREGGIQTKTLEVKRIARPTHP